MVVGGGGLLIRVCLGCRCCVPGATRLSRAAGLIRRAASQWSAPPSAPHGGRGGGPDEFGGFAAVESGGGGAAKKEASEGKEGGGDGWGDGDGWDDDFDASPAYPTLTAYDRNGVKVASPGRFSPTIFAGWWHCWPGAGRRGRTQPRCCEILAGSMLARSPNTSEARDNESHACIIVILVPFSQHCEARHRSRIHTSGF